MYVSHCLSEAMVYSAGVEHLLRDVKDSTISTLATEVGRMVTGLKGLKARLLEVEQYLQLVLGGKLPVNHDIMYQLQARFNGHKSLYHLPVLVGDVARYNVDQRNIGQAHTAIRCARATYPLLARGIILHAAELGRHL